MFYENVVCNFNHFYICAAIAFYKRDNELAEQVLEINAVVEGVLKRGLTENKLCKHKLEQ